jgi:hypothetical protein
MNENIKILINKINEDPEIAAKFSDVKDPEEAYEIASSIQDGFTKEEFMAFVEKIKGELSPEDLNMVAGGNVGEVVSEDGNTTMPTDFLRGAISLG